MLVEDLLTLTSAESRATWREDELPASEVLAGAGRQVCDLLTGRDLQVTISDEAPDAVVRGDGATWTCPYCGKPNPFGRPR